MADARCGSMLWLSKLRIEVAVSEPSVSNNPNVSIPPADPQTVEGEPPPSEQLISAANDNNFDLAREILANNPEQRDALLTQLAQTDPGALYRLNTVEDSTTTNQSQPGNDVIASTPPADSSWQGTVAKALDAINPVGKLQDLLQPQIANLTRSAGLGNTEWGASLQKVLDTPGSAAAFRQGVTEGLIRGAEDTVVGIVSLAGRAVQYGGDNSFLGNGGDALRGLTGKLPGWLDAAIPSAKRGEESNAAISKIGSNIANYVSTRAQDPSLLSGDVQNAIGGMWNSIKDDHAKAAAQGPEAEARWWGNIVGRVTFELAVTVVPVAGQAGKVDKASDVARATANVIDDPWKTAARASDNVPTPPTPATPPKKPVVPALMDSAASAASKIQLKLQHVLTGEINKSGKAVGFHSRPGGIDPPSARLTQRTNAPDVNGVYRGKVEVFDPNKGVWVPKKAQSTFFPDNMTHKQIENAVRNAYADALRNGNVNGSSWTGKSGLGFDISGYVDGNTITSAFPIYTP
jgi:hypothetical protein